MKEYKKKRRTEEYRMDNAPIKTKKYFNSSERWRGKREIEKKQKEIANININEIRFDLEQELHSKCDINLVYVVEFNLLITLYHLGFGWDEDYYSCECENLDILSDEEILIRAGY